jgi:hypothetical protein
MDKVTSEKGRIGAGWLEEDGSISVIIERFARLPKANLVYMSSRSKRAFTISV